MSIIACIFYYDRHEMRRGDSPDAELAIRMDKAREMLAARNRGNIQIVNLRHDHPPVPNSIDPLSTRCVILLHCALLSGGAIEKASESILKPYRIWTGNKGNPRIVSNFSKPCATVLRIRNENFEVAGEGAKPVQDKLEQIYFGGVQNAERLVDFLLKI